VHFSFRYAGRFAALLLILVFIGIAGFVVHSSIQTRDTSREVKRSAKISRAYDNARYAVLNVQLAAAAHLKAPTPQTREHFDATVDRAIAALNAIRDTGSDKDRALVGALYQKELPALDAVRRIFLAMERGEPIVEAIPDAATADRILSTLAAPAYAREQSAAADLNTLTSDQTANVRITVAVCTVGLLLVLALLAGVQSFSSRDARQRTELLQLRTAALTDSLTGLGNHRAFLEELRRQVAGAHRHDQTLTLATIDVDEFKNVNDTWGHGRGDSVLRDVAGLLNEFTRREDYVFRIGGDEFAIILPRTNGDDAGRAMERLRQGAARSLKDGPTLSIGVADACNSHGDETVLRQQADSALYEAKLRGRDATVVFAPSAGTKPVFPAAKINALRRLLSEGSVDAAFQPIWSLADSSLLGHEALARIPDEYNIAGPHLAFAIAERLGKCAELDATCRAAVVARLSEIGGDTLLFANLSPYTLSHASFSASALAAEFAAGGFPPHRVVLEISERSTVAVPVIEAAVGQLHAAGFQVALDDVGTGNAGLEMLRRVPVEFVKIDRDVLKSAINDTMGKAAVMAIVAFAAQAGAHVVADGVEDHRMMELVRWVAAGGDEVTTSMVYAVQGFLLGHPSSEFTSGERPSELAA
jgi:diguanylate cyclase (GGDEF)-like protein